MPLIRLTTTRDDIQDKITSSGYRYMFSYICLFLKNHFYRKKSPIGIIAQYINCLEKKQLCFRYAIFHSLNGTIPHKNEQTPYIVTTIIQFLIYYKGNQL